MYKYEVTIECDHSVTEVEFYVIKDKYTKWFDTLKEAKKYATSIKNELKKIFRESKIDNIITLDVNKYYTDREMLDEDYLGIWYSLNIVGKY